ncbi:MAG: EamA family transporter/4-amino-4-deoxy-L-arabinose transferase [Treponematales bacterium]
MKNILLIMASVSLNAAGQVLMRYEMRHVGDVPVSSAFFTMALPRMIGSGFLWLAFVCYGVSILLWTIVLSKTEVSFAYAFSSLGFVLVTVMGAVFLQEHVSALRITGIAVVCAGIILVARS